MTDNPVVMAVFLVLGGLVGIWGFFRFLFPALLINYPTMIVSNTLKFIPALAFLLCGQTAIQAEPVKRLNDHLTSQAESPEIVPEAVNTMEAVFVSADPVQVAGESQPTALPLQAATDPTQPTQPTQPNPKPEQPTQPTQPGEKPKKPTKPPTNAQRSQS